MLHVWNFAIFAPQLGVIPCRIRHIRFTSHVNSINEIAFSGKLNHRPTIHNSFIHSFIPIPKQIKRHKKNNIPSPPLLTPSIAIVGAHACRKTISISGSTARGPGGIRRGSIAHYGPFYGRFIALLPLVGMWSLCERARGRAPGSSRVTSGSSSPPGGPACAHDSCAWRACV